MSEISYWFVSHTDTDHVSGLKEVLVSGYRVEYLVFAKAVEKEAKTKELAEYSKMLDEAMATKAAYAAQLVGLQADETALKTERKA